MQASMARHLLALVLYAFVSRSRESSDRWVATVGRGGLMRGPPGEQTSGSLLYCEHYITAFVHLRNSFLQTLIQNIYCLDYALYYIPPWHAASDAPPPVARTSAHCQHVAPALQYPRVPSARPATHLLKHKKRRGSVRLHWNVGNDDLCHHRRRHPKHHHLSLIHI